MTKHNIRLLQIRCSTFIYLDWGTYDIRSPLEGWDIGRENSRFSDYLKEKGFTVAGGEVHDGFGWGSWRNRTDKVFEAFFPMEKAQNELSS